MTLFFVLSGYVLWSSFVRSYSSSLRDLPRYMTSRLYRLFPALVASMMLLPVFARTHLSGYSAIELGDNVLTLQNNINGVVWSLNVELVCSFMLFVFWVISRNNLIMLTAIAVSSIYVFYTSYYDYLVQAYSTKLYLILLFMPAFLFGALLTKLPKPVGRSAALIVIGVPLLVGASLILGHDWRSRFAEMLGAAMIVAYAGAAQPALLTSRSAHFLGLISYPFYLVHLIGLKVADPIAARYGGGHHWLPFLIYVVVSLSVAVPLAWIIHVTVELPGMGMRPMWRKGPKRSLTADIEIVPRLNQADRPHRLRAS